MGLFFPDQIKKMYQKHGHRIPMQMKFMEIYFKKKKEKFTMSNTNLWKKQVKKSYLIQIKNTKRCLDTSQNNQHLKTILQSNLLFSHSFTLYTPSLSFHSLLFTHFSIILYFFLHTFFLLSFIIIYSLSILSLFTFPTC